MEEEPPAVTAAERSPLAEATDAAETRADWRSSTEGALIVTALIGVWLIISAFAIAYEKPAAPAIWGVVVLVLALLRLVAAPQSASLGLVTAAAGALAVLTAFLLGDAAGPTANLALFGLAVVVLQFVGLGARAERRRTSRG